MFASYVLIEIQDSCFMKFPTIHQRALETAIGTGPRAKPRFAIDEAVPVPVLTTALYERFSSRGEADFANRLLSAMRYEFGGHMEKPVEKPQVA
jgi:6-phosphogluconate dehydrogenase